MKVVVLGGGSWGTVLAHLVSQNVEEVRIWVTKEDQARAINSTRVNSRYHPELLLNHNTHAYCSLEKIFEGSVAGVIWALPSSVCREQAKVLARYFKGDEILIHATKGVEEGSLKRVSEVLREEIPCPRIGVLSGPNLAHEVARAEPAATVIASYYQEVIDAGQSFLSTEKFRVYGARDVVGVEWAGALKNILAIAAGALDAMCLGWNSRAMLITRGLAEMVRFGVKMGAESSTFLGLAGVGDLLATCSSPLSRNYRVGYGLAQGKKLQVILGELKSTAEGVKTTKHVWEFARTQEIYMPITEGVYSLLYQGHAVGEVLSALMRKPPIKVEI